jgi:hypothetical protein
LASQIVSRHFRPAAHLDTVSVVEVRAGGTQR